MHALPEPRGPLSEAVLGALRGAPGVLAVPAPEGGPLDDDVQVTLYVLHELAYRPVPGVEDGWETEPSALALRVQLERALERVLREAVAPRVLPVRAPAAVPDALAALVAGGSSPAAPSLSAWVAEHATADHLREFAVHRSAYQLKEADPHSTAIVRLPSGAAKAALLDIQVDEYGDEPSEAHAALFADTMSALGLDPVADVDRLPAPTLVTNTLLTTFAASRRLLGALLGHLAVFEMSSVEPMARYAAAVRRLVPGPAGTRAARFYDVHVAADGRHQVVALERLVRSFVVEQPSLAVDVLFGAAALIEVERAMAAHILRCWERGESSLRRPLPASALAGATSGPDLRLAG